jgi:hypothetical protein
MGFYRWMLKPGLPDLSEELMPIKIFSAGITRSEAISGLFQGRPC